MLMTCKKDAVEQKSNSIFWNNLVYFENTYF